MFCHEFHLVDLRLLDNCLAVTKGCDHVFNLAADMGGMGFIQSNHSVIMYNNTMISYNMLEAGRLNEIKRCVCPRHFELSLGRDAFMPRCHAHLARAPLRSLSSPAASSTRVQVLLRKQRMRVPGRQAAGH